MKNKLAENMLRFGVKNLHKADVKKIQEVATLNEQQDIDLLPKYGKIFQQELLKGIKAQKPQIVFFAGPYYVWTSEPNPITYDTLDGVTSPVTSNIIGKFIDLQVETIPAIGPVPMLPGWSSGYGGMFEYKTGLQGGQMTQIMYSEESPVLNIKTTEDALGHIQTNFGKFSPQVIQQLYNISQNKAQIDQAIATLKTKPNIIAKLPANMKSGLNIA